MCKQEEYRGRGLAKAVSLRLLRERTTDFGQDGFAHADVAVDNLQSQGVCKSLKGTARWNVYCMFYPTAPCNMLVNVVSYLGKHIIGPWKRLG
jgi:hypothetical protein